MIFLTPRSAGEIEILSLRFALTILIPDDFVEDTPFVTSFAGSVVYQDGEAMEVAGVDMMVARLGAFAATLRSCT